MDRMFADQKYKCEGLSSTPSIHINKAGCDDMYLLALGRQREIPEAH